MGTGEVEIGKQRPMGRIPALRIADHDVNIACTGRARIGCRHPERVRESGLSPRQRRKAELSGRRVARWRIDAQKLKVQPLARRAQFSGWRVEGPVKFDGAKPCIRGRLHPVEQWPVMPEKSEIGGEFRHGLHGSPCLCSDKAVEPSRKAARNSACSLVGSQCLRTVNPTRRLDCGTGKSTTARKPASRS